MTPEAIDARTPLRRGGVRRTRRHPSLGPGPAPRGTPARIRGTVEKLDGRILTVKRAKDGTASVTLRRTPRSHTWSRRALADIKPGDFVASTGMKGTDGKIHAIEVRIFPKAQPDGGGQFAWDLGTGQRDDQRHGRHGVTKAPHGEVLHVTFKGGKSEYVRRSRSADPGPGAGRHQPVEAGRRGLRVRPKASGRQLDRDPALRREERHQAADVEGMRRRRSVADEYPWNDYSGRLSPLKLTVFVALFLPAAVDRVRASHGLARRAAAQRGDPPDRPVDDPADLSSRWRSRRCARSCNGSG